MEKVARNLSFFDRWVITYFRVLPTDPRFKSLLEEVKELLFYIYIHTPTEGDTLLDLKQHLVERFDITPDKSAKKAAKKLGIDLDNAIANITGMKKEEKE